MQTNKLSGLIAAPFTPMYANGQLNLSLIPAYYMFLKRNRVKGAFICGSTGEGVSMTTREKMLVAEAWAAAVKDDEDFKVMTLLGGNSLADCKELAKHALSIGLYAVSFTAPNYFKPASVSILAACCMEVAAAAPELPFYYYHIPVLNGVGFAMLDLLRELDGKMPNLAGIKYTHEDFMDYLSCIQFKNGRYDMLWGRDENMLPALAVGAKGAVGSTFNYAAPLYHQLMSSYELGQMGNARKLQQQSIDMIRLLGKYGGISAGKAYMKLAGVDCGEFRLPVMNMTASDFDRFAEDATAVGFREFQSK